jgi:hypothetical protein
MFVEPKQELGYPLEVKISHDAHVIINEYANYNSNYNPRYAHQMITIFRTPYNFIWERKYCDGKKMTPAQRIGLVEKKYSYRNIIYFR